MAKKLSKYHNKQIPYILLIGTTITAAIGMLWWHNRIPVNSSDIVRNVPSITISPIQTTHNQEDNSINSNHADISNQSPPVTSSSDDDFEYKTTNPHTWISDETKKYIIGSIGIGAVVGGILYYYFGRSNNGSAKDANKIHPAILNYNMTWRDKLYGIAQLDKELKLLENENAKLARIHTYKSLQENGFFDFYNGIIPPALISAVLYGAHIGSLYPFMIMTTGVVIIRYIIYDVNNRQALYFEKAEIRNIPKTVLSNGRTKEEISFQIEQPKKVKKDNKEDNESTEEEEAKEDAEETQINQNNDTTTVEENKEDDQVQQTMPPKKESGNIETKDNKKENKSIEEEKTKENAPAIVNNTNEDAKKTLLLQQQLDEA